MLKRNKILYSTAALITFTGVCLGGVYAYGDQSTIPMGITFDDWQVGGLKPEEFQTQWEQRKQEIEQKTIRFTLPSGEERNFILKDLPLQLDADDTIHSLLMYGKEGNFFSRAWKRWSARKGINYSLSVKWDEAELKNRIQQWWPDLAHHEPKDAQWFITDQDDVQLIPDQSAANLNVEKLSQAIAAVKPKDLLSIESLSIPIPMEETKAKVTLDDLKKTAVERKIAEFSTDYAANAGGRTHNVEATAKVLNNTLLKPGEVFDYSKIITETETKYGYQPAPEIVGGKLEMGIGGGICQVSSTLYNDVLLSNLEVVDRTHHSIPVGYIPMGRDATYSDDAINFEFKNNTEKDLLIQTSAKDGLLTIKMFGSAPLNREIEVSSETVGTLDPGTQVVTDPSLAPGERKVVSQGRTGYKVKVYKSIKENGQLKEKILVSTDIYKPQPAIIHVGVNKQKG